MAVTKIRHKRRSGSAARNGTQVQAIKSSNTTCSQWGEKPRPWRSTIQRDNKMTGTTIAPKTSALARMILFAVVTTSNENKLSYGR